MDISTFILFKSNINTQELNNEILKKLNILFPDVEKRNKNKYKNNILKTQKIQNQKENISNKVNLILNKLSEKNIDSLIIEFIEKINQVSNETFKEIQKTFYLKIISEINFINIYIEFLKIIGYLYNQIQEYNLSYFFEIVESKFKNDYTTFEINNNINFLNELNSETNRTNNLILINTMIEYKLISNEIYNYCDEIILNQTLFLSDIYYWFNSKNRKLTNHENLKIKELLNKNITPRDLILLKNLLQYESSCNIKLEQVIVNIKPEQVIVNIKQNINTINLECNYIIEEYLLYKSINDIKYFIDTRCDDTINKNKFCENLINKFFTLNKETSDEIIQLLKQLVKSRILFKSNLSRGLLLIYHNWDDISIDYDNPILKIKLLLSTLKSIGITKGLEELLEKYKIL